jgi:hypothetical protein
MSEWVAGPLIYVDWIDNSGTIPIHGDYTKFNFQRKTDKAEITAGADVSRNYLPTIADYPVSIEAFFNRSGGTPAIGTAVLHRLREKQYGTLRWGLEGNGTGSPKGAIYCFVETQEVDAPNDGPVTVKLDFQTTGGSGSGVGLISDPTIDVW